MMEYKCTVCGVEGVRMWRQYQTFLDRIKLMCMACAEADQDRICELRSEASVFRSRRGPSDQIGWLIPAVPTSEGDTYWGYSSVPQDRIEWWQALPLEEGP